MTSKRLYTEEHFANKMPEVTKPEIERSPLAHVIMQLLAAKVRNVRKFEFLDRPPEDAIKTALNELKILGVSKDVGQNELELTDLGHKIGLDTTCFEAYDMLHHMLHMIYHIIYIHKSPFSVGTSFSKVFVDCSPIEMFRRGNYYCVLVIC